MTFLLCSVLTLSALGTSAADTKQLVRMLEGHYRSARTLQATFLERYSENGQVVRAEAGVAFFRRPGKMRWEYQSPEKNVFVVDGKTAWFYVPADRTVTRVPAKQSTDWRTPLALLAGEMKLSRVCGKVEPASDEKPGTPGNTVLYCPPRGEEDKPRTGAGKDAREQASGPEDSIYLEIEPSTGNLARVVVREKAGVEIEFKFADWRFDPSVSDSLFRFEVPLGVAIVNGESPAESRP
jgi:outer membrane lipoprotein carrier protein